MFLNINNLSHEVIFYGARTIVIQITLCYALVMNTEGDLVIIYMNEVPTLYARIEAINPDHKPDWWQVDLLLLTHPAQRVTWTLREEYFNGSPFTMQGTPMLIKALEVEEPALETPPPARSKQERAPVVSLAEMRSRKKE